MVLGPACAIPGFERLCELLTDGVHYFARNGQNRGKAVGA